jgi:c-di-GMP-binding flagellar brake protein YcgR
MSKDKVRGNDRRNSERVQVEARLRLYAYRDGERLALSGQANDLSEGGLSVYVPTELEIGDTLDLEITLPYSTHPTRAKAVVRTRDNYRYGLQFVDLHPKQQESLARACKLADLMR